MICFVAGTLIDGREHFNGCDQSQGARLADFDGIETQGQFHLHQTLNRCGGDESAPPYVATGRLWLPNTDIGTHVASLGNLDNVIGDAWSQTSNVTRLQDIIELRPHFVRYPAMKIAPHFWIFDVRVHARKRGCHLYNLLCHTL